MPALAGGKGSAAAERRAVSGVGRGSRSGVTGRSITAQPGPRRGGATAGTAVKGVVRVAFPSTLLEVTRKRGPFEVGGRTVRSQAAAYAGRAHHGHRVAPPFARPYGGAGAANGGRVGEGGRGAFTAGLRYLGHRELSGRCAPEMDERPQPALRRTDGVRNGVLKEDGSGSPAARTEGLACRTGQEGPERVGGGGAIDPGRGQEKRLDG